LAFAGALAAGDAVAALLVATLVLATLLVALVVAAEAALVLTTGADVAEAAALDAVACVEADVEAVTDPPQAARSPTLTTLPTPAMTERRLKRLPVGNDDGTMTFSLRALVRDGLPQAIGAV